MKKFKELKIDTKSEWKAWYDKYFNTKSVDDIKTYDDLPNEIKEVLDEWIKKHFRTSMKTYKIRSSYGFKHDFKRDTDIYIYNGAFKGAMLKAGFEVANENDLNWYFRVRFVKDA